MSGHPLTRWPRNLIDWLCSGREDYQAFEQRKRTRGHRSKRTLCLGIWLIAALLMLNCPGVGCVVALILAATFLSFAVMDE